MAAYPELSIAKPAKDVRKTLHIATVSVGMNGDLQRRFLQTRRVYCHAGELVRLAWIAGEKANFKPHPRTFIVVGWSLQTLLSRTNKPAVWKLFSERVWNRYVARQPKYREDVAVKAQLRRCIFENWEPPKPVIPEKLLNCVSAALHSDPLVVDTKNAAYQHWKNMVKTDLTNTNESKHPERLPFAIFAATRMGIRGGDRLATFFKEKRLANVAKALTGMLATFKDGQNVTVLHYLAALAWVLLFHSTGYEQDMPVKTIHRLVKLVAIACGELRSGTLSSVDANDAIDGQCRLLLQPYDPKTTQRVHLLIAAAGITCFVSFVNLEAAERKWDPNGSEIHEKDNRYDFGKDDLIKIDENAPEVGSGQELQEGMDELKALEQDEADPASKFARLSVDPDCNLEGALEGVANNNDDEDTMTDDDTMHPPPKPKPKMETKIEVEAAVPMADDTKSVASNALAETESEKMLAEAMDKIQQFNADVARIESKSPVVIEISSSSDDDESALVVRSKKRQKSEKGRWDQAIIIDDDDLHLRHKPPQRSSSSRAPMSTDVKDNGGMPISGPPPPLPPRQVDYCMTQYSCTRKQEKPSLAGLWLRILPGGVLVFQGVRGDRELDTPQWFADAISALNYSSLKCRVRKTKRDLRLIDLADMRNMEVLSKLLSGEDARVFSIYTGYGRTSLQPTDADVKFTVHPQNRYEDKDPKEVMIAAVGYLSREDETKRLHIALRFANVLCSRFGGQIDGWIVDDSLPHRGHSFGVLKPELILCNSGDTTAEMTERNVDAAVLKEVREFTNGNVDFQTALCRTYAHFHKIASLHREATNRLVEQGYTNFIEIAKLVDGKRSSSSSSSSNANSAPPPLKGMDSDDEFGVSDDLAAIIVPELKGKDVEMSSSSSSKDAKMSDKKEQPCEAVNKRIAGEPVDPTAQMSIQLPSSLQIRLNEKTLKEFKKSKVVVIARAPAEYSDEVTPAAYVLDKGRQQKWGAFFEVHCERKEDKDQKIVTFDERLADKLPRIQLRFLSAVQCLMHKLVLRCMATLQRDRLTEDELISWLQTKPSQNLANDVQEEDPVAYCIECLSGGSDLEHMRHAVLLNERSVTWHDTSGVLALCLLLGQAQGKNPNVRQAYKRKEKMREMSFYANFKTSGPLFIQDTSIANFQMPAR